MVEAILEWVVCALDALGLHDWAMRLAAATEPAAEREERRAAAMEMARRWRVAG